MAKDVLGMVNMYRVTGDDWDTWGDVKSHFDIARWLHCYILVLTHFYLPLEYLDNILFLNPWSVIPSLYHITLVI